MEMEKCPRCGTLAYLEIHHILPQSTFDGKGKTERLCPNCHTEYHKKMGNKSLQNPDEDFHDYHFWHWYYTGLIVLLIIVSLGIYDNQKLLLEYANDIITRF